jgi:hypothetical protein
MLRSPFSEQTPYLAAITTSRDLKKSDLIPTDCVGFTVSGDSIELISKNDQNLSKTAQDRKARLVGYFPQHPFVARIAMDKVLTGDSDFVDLRVETRVVIEDPRDFIEKTLFEEHTIDKYEYYLKPRAFTDDIAAFIRRYEATDLSSGRLNQAFMDFLKETLTLNLRYIGLRLLDVKTISLWLSAEQSTVMGKIASKLGDFNSPASFNAFMAEENLEEKMTLHQAETKNVIDEPLDWFESIKSFFTNKESGKNYRMQKIIKNTEENTKKPPVRRKLRWWLFTVIAVLIAVLTPISTTFHLFKDGWDPKVWKVTILLIVWTFALFAIIFSVRRLVRRLKKVKESEAAKEDKQSPVMTVSRFSEEDRIAMNRRVRQQVSNEFENQKGLLERVRSSAYRAGREELALQAYRMQKTLDENIDRILNPNYAVPVYLQENQNLSKNVWEKLIESEETLLIQAALLNQELEAFERKTIENTNEIPSLAEYEASVKQFMNDFNNRSRLV